MSRKRNPFADSDDDSEEEDDFVDLSELPPLPQKSVSKPSLLPPKQKINKTRSEAQRIGIFKSYQVGARKGVNFNNCIEIALFGLAG